MKIAIDLDGVCYEWDRTARYMLREYRNLSHVPVLQHPSEDWDSIQKAIDKADWKWLWSEGVRLGLFRYGHMVKGCRVGLQQLVARGHQLEVVTHRPAKAVNDTLDWISLYFKDVPLHGLTILTNQEPKTVSEADILIDDKPANCLAWYNTDRVALLFDRPHNRGMVGAVNKKAKIIRVADWAHVVEEVQLELRRERAGGAVGSIQQDAEPGDQGWGEQASLWTQAPVVEGRKPRSGSLLSSEQMEAW